MIRKPLIGITFDSNEPGGYSRYPWYALRENYCSSLVEAGSVPFPLIHDLSLIEDYLSHIDGLVITGGHYDIEPTLYGDTTCHPRIQIKKQRTNFELEITKAALKKNLPILGICGGQQLLNVALGGTLIQHIPDSIPNCLSHEQPPYCVETSHEATVLEGTLLHKWLGESEIEVNSAHHQAVRDLGKGLVVNALAPDGVIEGFEGPDYKFCLGIQWHPEFFVTPYDRKIFEAFLAHA